MAIVIIVSIIYVVFCVAEILIYVSWDEFANKYSNIKGFIFIIVIISRCQKKYEKHGKIIYQ